MKLLVLLLLALAVLPPLAVAGEGDSPKTPADEFRVTTRNADDAVAVRPGKDRTVLAVTSPSGIGQAVVERRGDAWPRAVVLRLHLKGLESFRASGGKVTLAAAVSAHKEGPRVRVWEGDREDAPLDVKSPLWMDVRRVGGDGPFEVALPRAFFAGNPRSITLKWIDFYR